MSGSGRAPLLPDGQFFRVRKLGSSPLEPAGAPGSFFVLVSTTCSWVVRTTGGAIECQGWGIENRLSQRSLGVWSTAIARVGVDNLDEFLVVLVPRIEWVIDGSEGGM